MMTNAPSWLCARLTAADVHRLALFLDFDGTLAPIVDQPEAAKLPVRVRRDLVRLARTTPLVIVSGRPVIDLRRRVNVAGVRYVGLHGAEAGEGQGPLRFLGPRPTSGEVRSWAEALTTAAAGISGALVECKPSSVVLHDRRVPQARRALLSRRTRMVLAPLVRAKRIALLRGKRVVEVRMVGVQDKGRAVTALLREPWARNRTPVYVGDDRTDDDALRVIRPLGIGVHVGRRRPNGPEHGSLPGPEAVGEVLGWLADRIEEWENQR